MIRPSPFLSRMCLPAIAASLPGVFLLGFLLCQVACGAERLNNRVLVVYVRNSPDSEAVAKHYVAVRHIPPAHLCAIHLADPEAILLSADNYEKEVKQPIADCLNKTGKERILYIVLAYIRPYRVDPGGLHNYALDSFLSDIWDYYTSKIFNPLPAYVHPYYADNRPRENIYLPFVSLADFRSPPEAPLLYSVWRLDGPTPAIARSLVDKAIRTEAVHGPLGQACIDERTNPLSSPYTGTRMADWDLYSAARLLSAAGFKVLEDSNETEFGTPPSPNCPDAALYSGWYKFYNYNDAFTWNEGAIGFHLDSGSALDLRVGKSWSFHALEHGITVTSGAMDEPYLVGLPRPDGVFHDLLAGANVGDAFLRNTRYLKWMILNVGDPLYTPFPGGKVR
jgi:uncharacterized protein (TIGR03790 family)